MNLKIKTKSIMVNIPLAFQTFLGFFIKSPNGYLFQIPLEIPTDRTSIEAHLNSKIFRW